MEPSCFTSVLGLSGFSGSTHPSLFAGAMALLSSQAVLFHTPRFLPSPPSPSSSRFPSCSPISSPASFITLCSSKFKTRQREQPFTARASLSDSSERIGEVLSDMGVYAATTGEFVKFVDLWDQKEGMAVIALLRHFGCPCCWELALTLKESMSNFDSAGVKLIAVGVGTPDKARILAERLPFPLDRLYADPDRKAYDALGLYYGFGRTFFNPASAKVFSRFDALKKAVKNYTMEATPDDKSSVLQQGGMFVFKGKQLLYSRKDEGTGDHAPLEEVLNICCSASVA